MGNELQFQYVADIPYRYGRATCITTFRDVIIIATDQGYILEVAYLFPTNSYVIRPIGCQPEPMPEPI